MLEIMLEILGIVCLILGFLVFNSLPEIKEKANAKRMLKKGFIKVRIVGANFRVRSFWVKPMPEIKIENKTYRPREKFCVFEGKIPVYYFNESDFTPIDMLKRDRDKKVSPDFVSALIIKAKLAGALEKSKDDKMLFYIGIITLLCAVASAYASYSMMSTYDPIIKSIPTICSAVHP